MPLMLHLFSGLTPFTIRELSLRDYWALRCWADEHRRQNNTEE